MKGLRWVFIFYFVMIFFCAISSIFEETELISNPFDYARITDVDYKAVVVDEPGSQGKVVITERLTFDIHAASKNNLFWELWRDLPEDYIDGLKVDYKVNSVKQIYEDGSELIYKESPRLYWDDNDYIDTSLYGPGKWYHSGGPYSEYNRLYECVFFYVDGIYREKVVFEIEYEMSNAALKYNDVSELYLAFYSEDTIKHLNSFKGQVLIPNKDMPSKGNYEAHTYGTNNGSFEFNESDTLNPGYHTFIFDLDDDELKFNKHNQYIEFSLLSYNDDSHIFTDYAPDNYYSDDDVLDELRQDHATYEFNFRINKKIKFILFIICLVISIITILSTLTKDKRIKKKYNMFKPTNDFTYFRDIPSNLDPYFAASLVFSKHGDIKDESNGYSAIMLSLIRKKYIELDKIDVNGNWDSNNIKIVIKYRPEETMVQTTDIPYQEPTLAELVSRTLSLQPEITFPKEDISTYDTSSIVSVEPTPQELYAANFEPLTATEKHYFRLISRHATGYEIEMNKFQSRVRFDYENTNSFVNNVNNEIINIGISKGYFQKADYKQVKRQVKSRSTSLMIWGILFVTVFNFILSLTPFSLAYGGFTILGVILILCSIYLNKLSKKYILFTQFGEDEYAKWRGLYNYLNSATLMNERTVIELPIWEQYLVYATAFGISEKVVQALEIRCPDMELSSMLKNPYYRSSGYRSTSRSFRSATRSASYTSHSRSYSSYGGYGGGGRGGGGGGGGH